jgi:putative oxidoreductase
MRKLFRPVTAARDVILLVVRVGLGVIFLAHGWQKFDTFGVDATAKAFAGMGIPAPTASAYFATAVEVLGGAALILGALTTLAGLLLAAHMAGAFLFVHRDNGVFVAEGGWELVAALGLLSLALAAVGAGKLSVDAALTRSTSRAKVGV